MDNRVVSLVVIAALTLLAPLLQAQNPVAAPTSEELDAYRVSVFAYVRDRCVRCHETRQNPRFAVADAAASYQVARNYVNFINIRDSAFIERVTNGHCGRNCQTDGSAMTAALQRWREAVDPSTFGPPTSEAQLVTRTIPLPSPLPTGTSFASLRWNLAEGQPANPNLAGVVLELSAQAIGSDGYLFQRPRVISPTRPVRVRNLTVRINDRPMAETRRRFNAVSVTVPASTVGTIVSSYSEIAIKDRPTGDSISISIGEIETAIEVPACRALQRFESDVLPMMTARNCFHCHGGGSRNLAGSGRARQLLPMTGTSAQLCSRILPFIDAERPFQSVLLWWAMGNAPEHPEVLPFAEEVIPSWSDWMQAEQ